MKKFNFTLQKVLEIKEQLLESLKGELNYLNHQMIKLESDIKKEQEKYLRVHDELNFKSKTSITSGELSYYKMYMYNIIKSIEKKEEEKTILIKKTEDMRNEILNMNMEISSFEKLKEKEKEKYNHALIKSEEIFIEEFVSNKSMAKQYLF